MAEFQEVLKQWRRMCDVCTCSNEGELIDFQECPIILNHCGYPCDECPQDWTEEATKQFEKIVMQWAAENPEPVYPTWLEWLKEQGLYTGRVVITKDEIDVDVEMTGEIYNRIPADIAEKLGIEPKK